MQTNVTLYPITKKKIRFVSTVFPFVTTERTEKVPLYMAIENIDCCPQHFAHGTSKLKENKEVEEDKQKCGHAISPDGLRSYRPTGSQL